MIEHELSSLGAVPVAEDNPSGESVRYEPEFEQLEAEMAKLESLKGEPVDWKAVVRLSSDILGRKSKDMLVSVYLCQGLLQTEGYRGLAVGLQIINDMTSTFWESMYPAVKRLRARKVAMEWLSEKASQFIGTHAPSDKDSEAVLQAARMSREIDGFLTEKMENEAPALTDLTRPLKQFSEAIKRQQAAKPIEPPTPPVQSVESAPVELRQAPQADISSQQIQTPQSIAQSAPPQKTAAAESIQTNVESDGDARKMLKQIQDGVRKIASFYTKTKLSDPKAYRLARTAAWITIDQLPPNKDGVTQIPPPPADRRKHMSGLFEQSQFNTLVTEIEPLMAKSAFWFDGQRILSSALKSMGNEFASARETVISELRNFVVRLPGVTDLKFSDGTPFADDTTHMWLDAEVLVQAASPNAKAGVTCEISSPWELALAEAKGKVSSGQLDKAVSQFHEGIERSKGIREEFYWRTGLSELLIQTGNLNVAIQMLEQMSQRIESKQLEEWESGLVVPVYRRLYEAYQKIAAKKKGDAAIVAKMDSIYSRLCWLDPMMAITVKGE